MKKTLLTLCALCLSAFTAVAQTYTENLVVTVDGNSAEPQSASITVTRNSDNTACDFTLKNFRLKDEVSDIPVGNITLKNVTMTNCNGYYELATTQTIQIAAGDEEGVNADDWLGPELGDVPVEFTGLLNDTKLYANIDIDMTLLEQVINVKVGEENKDVISAITNAVRAASSTSTAVYNLNGVRVANSLNKSLPKGVYIVGGKKIVK